MKQQLAITDGLQHINSSLVHFTASIQVFLKESQNPEKSTVILQDLYMICHMALHLKVLFGLKSDERWGDRVRLEPLVINSTTEDNG